MTAVLRCADLQLQHDSNDSTYPPIPGLKALILRLYKKHIYIHIYIICIYNFRSTTQSRGMANDSAVMLSLMSLQVRGCF